MPKLLIILLCTLSCTCLSQKKVQQHEHFVIKDWETFRESGDTLIYTDVKIIRGHKKPRKEAFYFKHPETVKYLEDKGILIVWDHIQAAMPYALQEQRQSEPGTKTVVNFREETCKMYSGGRGNR